MLRQVFDVSSFAVIPEDGKRLNHGHILPQPPRMSRLSSTRNCRHLEGPDRTTQPVLWRLGWTCRRGPGTLTDLTIRSGPGTSREPSPGNRFASPWISSPIQSSMRALKTSERSAETPLGQSFLRETSRPAGSPGRAGHRKSCSQPVEPFGSPRRLQDRPAARAEAFSSKRSKFMTLTQAATKSSTTFRPASLLA